MADEDYLPPDHGIAPGAKEPETSANELASALFHTDHADLYDQDAWGDSDLEDEDFNGDGDVEYEYDTGGSQHTGVLFQACSGSMDSNAALYCSSNDWTPSCFGPKSGR